MLALSLLPAGQSARRGGDPILVVEDDPGVLDMLLWTLEEDGLPVVGVADGRAALDWIAVHRPALVLLDISLPFVDGYGVAEGLRRAYGQAVPIVVMTAGARAAESARRVGARDFVTKPFDLEELLAMLRRILDQTDR